MEWTGRLDQIEGVRRRAVVHRIREQASAGRVADRLLKGFSADQMASAICVFSYFSHLANIAADRKQARHREHHESAGPLPLMGIEITLSRTATGRLRPKAPLRSGHFSAWSGR